MRTFDIPHLTNPASETAAPGEVGEVVDLGAMPDDGFVLQVIRPKAAILIGLADVAIEGTTPQKFKASMQLLRDLLTPESHDYLFNRLDDRADSLDVSDLGPIITAMTEVISGKDRPTGSGNA